MGVKRPHKPIIFFCLFIILGILFFFSFVKIWGEKLLVKDWYRQELVFSGEMTISEFGKVNQLKSPLLKNVFGLTSDEDFPKKLEGLSLNQKEVLNQVNNELSVQAKSENILVKWFNEISRKLLHNFGLVTKDIQRSGQPSPAALWLHYELFPFKSVINLAWEPKKSKDQVFERKFCEKRNIDYYNFSWNAGGPKDWGEVDKVIRIIDSCKKPVWIHCKGGKDRTGGLVAIWKKEKGYPMGLVFEDFKTYGIPAFTWVQQLFCGNLSNVYHMTSCRRSGHPRGPPLARGWPSGYFATGIAPSLTEGTWRKGFIHQPGLRDIEALPVSWPGNPGGANENGSLRRSHSHTQSFKRKSMKMINNPGSHFVGEAVKVVRGQNRHI